MGIMYKLKKVEQVLQGTIRQACEYLLVLAVILECNSVYRCVWERPDLAYHLQISSLIIGLILLFSLLWEDRKRCKSVFESCPLLCVILLFEILFLFFNVIKTWAVSGYILHFLMFLPLMIIIFKIYCSIDEHYKLFYVLSDIVFVLAALSLVIWIMAIVIGKLQPTGEIIVDWAIARPAKNYFNLSIYWQTEKLPFIGEVILRNTGIFGEAPMYNIFLNTALFTELFLKEQRDWFRCVVISLTICTTIGTLGVLLMAGAWLMRLFFNIRNSKIKLVFLLTAFFTAVFALILIIQKWKMAWGSFSTHIDDYVASIKAWLEHPIIGCGYEHEVFIQGFMSEFRIGNPGLSNSIAVVLAEGGIVLFLFYLLPFLFFIYQIRTPNGRRRIVPWGIGMFGIYVVTIFHFRFFMMMILAFGYSFLTISSGEEHICCFSCCDVSAKFDAKIPPKGKWGYINCSVIVLCLGLIFIALTGIGMRTILSVMDKYQLALENNQWNGLILAAMVILIICLVGNILRVTGIKKNK